MSGRRRSRGRSRSRRGSRGASSARALGAVAGDAVPGPLEARVAARCPCAADRPGRATRSGWPAPSTARRPREAVPAEHLPDGRVRRSRSRRRPGAAPSRSRGGSRRSAPAARPRAAAAERRGRLERSSSQRPDARSAAAVEPAVPPAVRRRRRHAEGGRGRLQRSSPPRSLAPARAGQPVRAWR